MLHFSHAAAQAASQPALSAVSDQPALGMWQLTVTFLDGPQAGQTETTVASLGHNQVIASSNTSLLNQGCNTSSPLLTGWGQWCAIGSHRFLYSFHQVALSPTNTLLFLIQVSAHASLSADGLSFEAQGEGTAYSPEGLLLGTVHSHVQATRLTQPS